MRIPSFKLLVAVTAVLAVGASHHALAEDISTPELTTYRLDNGLEVILASDHKVPKVAMTLRYRVGGLNEPDGRSGFAHLFEHLTLFAGTEAYPNVDAALTGLGIVYNGYTQEDGTTYYATGMSSTLPVMLSVHADQMANIGASVDQADLDLQRSVVMNEMRQNILDAPAGAALAALQTGMFPEDHPYSRAVIGSIADLQAATLDDVRSFFNAYYAPNNAVLVVVGDFEASEAKAMIESTFGPISRGIDAALPELGEPMPTRTRIEVTDAVATPIVYLGFSGPDITSDDNAELMMAGGLLSTESGLLRERLVNTGLATYAGGGWTQGRLGGRFIVYAGAAANVTAQQLEEAMRQTIAEFVAAQVDAADFERMRSGVLLADREVIEAFQSRSLYIASTMALEGDVSHVLEDDPDFVTASVAGMEAAIDDVLVLDDASVAIVNPGPRGDYPPVLTEPSGVPSPLLAPDRQPVAVPVLTAGQPTTAKLPERQTATLSNGIEVIHYRMEGAPMLYVSATVTGGANNDPRGKEGLYSLALDMGYRGAGERDFPALGRALRDIGGTVGTWTGSVSSGATLSVPPDKLATGVELLADVVQKPRFAPEEWEIVKAGTLNYLVQRDSDLTDMAQRALDQVVFFPDEDDSEVAMTAESVQGLTLEEAATTYEDLFTPKTMVIYSVGDLPLEAVTAALESRFGKTWQDADEGVAAKASLQAVFPEERQVYLVPMPGTSQATIHIARAAPGYDDPTFADASAVTNLLASDFSSRLNSVIREQKGYSYGVSASLWGFYLHDSAMTVTIPVQIDATGPALQEAFKGFDSLVERPVTETEVTRTITSSYTSLAGLPETSAGFFGALVGFEKQGIPLDSAIAYTERMTQLDVGDVQAEAMRLAMLDRAVIIIAGDPALILPQLAAMGITDVETITMPTTALPAG